MNPPRPRGEELTPPQHSHADTSQYTKLLAIVKCMLLARVVGMTNHFNVRSSLPQGAKNEDAFYVRRKQLC